MQAPAQLAISDGAQLLRFSKNIAGSIEVPIALSFDGIHPAPPVVRLLEWGTGSASHWWQIRASQHYASLRWEYKRALHYSRRWIVSSLRVSHHKISFRNPPSFPKSHIRHLWGRWVAVEEAYYTTKRWPELYRMHKFLHRPKGCWDHDAKYKSLSAETGEVRQGVARSCSHHHSPPLSLPTTFCRWTEASLFKTSCRQHHLVIAKLQLMKLSSVSTN